MSEDAKEFISKQQLEEELKKAKDQFGRTLNEYRIFAFKGDLLKLASALIIAGLVEGFVRAINSGLLMPLINFIVLHSVGNWRDTKWTPLPGLTFEIGQIINSGLNLVLITILLFFMIKWLGKLNMSQSQPPSPPQHKKSPRKKRT